MNGIGMERNLRHETVWYLRHIVIGRYFWGEEQTCPVIPRNEMRMSSNFCTSHSRPCGRRFLFLEWKTCFDATSHHFYHGHVSYMYYANAQFDILFRMKALFAPYLTVWKSGIVCQAKSARILSSLNVMLMGTCLGFSSVIHSALWTTNSMKDFYSD